MQFSVATNFDDTLVDRIKNYPVAELYGKLSADAVGGGRASFMLPRVGRRQVEAHVAVVRRAGIRFNYLLNAACMSNVEYTRRGQRAIRNLLDWLSAIGVDGVTVAIPFLLEIVKSDYPHLKAKVGVFAQVDNLRKAKAWEAMGADEKRELLDHIDMCTQLEDILYENPMSDIISESIPRVTRARSYDDYLAQIINSCKRIMQ